MKKYIMFFSVFFVLTFILTGCSSSDNSGKEGKEGNQTEQSTGVANENTKEGETREDTAGEAVNQEDTSAAEPITLVDDGFITFQVTGREPYEPGEFAVWYDVTLTNKSDKELLISSVGDSFKVNEIYVGEIVNGIMETIAPGQTVETTLSFRVGLNDEYNYELPENNDFTGAKINGTISVYDSANTSIKLGTYPFEFKCD